MRKDDTRFVNLTPFKTSTRNRRIPIKKARIFARNPNKDSTRWVGINHKYLHRRYSIVHKYLHRYLWQWYFRHYLCVCGIWRRVRLFTQVIREAEDTYHYEKLMRNSKTTKIVHFARKLHRSNVTFFPIIRKHY